MRPFLQFTALALTVTGGAAQAQDNPWDHAAHQALIQAAAVAGPTQSTDPNHPGSSVYPFSSFKVTTFKTKDGKDVRVWTPTGLTQKRPLVVWGGGKSLGNVANYQAMFEHLVKKGLVVAQVQFEGGFFDTDFVKFARWFNQATIEVLGREPLADAGQITYAGHSLGAQVATIATGLATGDDPTNKIPDPRALVLHAFDNSCGPNCSGSLTDPAKGYAKKIAQSVHTTILEYDDDTIAGPSKGYAQAMYTALPSVRKQWVRVLGKSFGTTYALESNHNTCLTGGGAPLNIGGAAVLNALDWHMGWKLLAGLPMALAGLGGGTAEPYVYGALTVDGGTAGDGRKLNHELRARSF